MKKILVPTDFSPEANKALDVAVQIAKQAKAEIILIHACDLLNTTFKDNQAIYKEYNQAIIDKANKRLSFSKKSVEDPDISVNIKLYNGNITNTILQASEEHQADIIIMGSLSEARLKEKIFGCKTADIIGRTNIPVLAVPLLEWAIPEKILMTVNNFEEQPDITNLVFELAVLFNATVHIIMFNEADPDKHIDYLERKKTVSAYIEKLKATYKSTDIKHTYLYGQTFQETIEEFIHEQGIDIVAMVTHKRTFMESIFNRSMTKKMFYNTQIPLLIIPAVNKKSSFKKTIENENKYSNAWI